LARTCTGGGEAEEEEGGAEEEEEGREEEGDVHAKDSLCGLNPPRFWTKEIELEVVMEPDARARGCVAGQG
jgi:hypothetical protein